MDPSDLAASTAINQAMALYLKQVNYKAGKFKVALKIYNDATSTSEGWDPVQCATNAQQHIASSTEVAVMGTFNSGCAKIEVPILNQAPHGPMLMVSNANTSPGLTKPANPGEPNIYYPTGVRNYARVCTTDDQQGIADAEFLKSIGIHSVYVINDTQTYGRGISQAFIAKAKSIGIKVLSPGVYGDSWNPGQSDYTSLFQKIAPLNPDAIYAGGSYSNNGMTLIKDKVAVLGDNSKVRFMAPDGFTGFPDFDAAPEAQGAYLSFAGLTTELLVKDQPNGVAAKFLKLYESTYGSAPVGSYAMYGVAALQVILAAIAQSDGTVKGVNNAVFQGSGITVPASISVLDKALHISTGTGGVAVGDTTAKDVTIEQVTYSAEVTLEPWTVK